MARHRFVVQVSLLAAALLAGCVPAAPPTATRAATDAPLPTATPRPPGPTQTPRPTLQPTPPPSATPLPAELVWLAPNMGSRDYLELFTRPDEWSVARAKLNVFKFYTQNLLPDPCPICGENTLDAFVRVDAFRRLADWGLAVAVEVGAVKEWGCTGEAEYHAAQTVIDNVQSNGGTVAILAMDEPLLGGQLEANGLSCGMSPAQSAAVTARFAARVAASYPHMLVGDIEPYPHYSVAELESWLEQLLANGFTPAFFHLDVDVERVRVDGHDVAADLQALERISEARGIPFGVILTSNWREAGSNQAYFESTLAWTRTVQGAIGRPAHVIFQSWQGPAASGRHEAPINLPQNDPGLHSHIRLINEGLALLGP